ncbi:hypothetical protein ISS39_10660 [Candidatus Bathyarchaeota archaeon]|nr:hypothetical protein [Candidatus Bathyarchaeota archaeon]
MKSHKRSIQSLLENLGKPCDVERIRREMGLSNWNTVLRHCLELYITGEVEGLKTTRGWVFWSDIPTSSVSRGKPPKGHTHGSKNQTEVIR